MAIPVRLHRSELCVPGTNMRMLEKAPSLGADVVMLDLEDAVAPDRKALARSTVVGFLRGAGRAWVRLNGIDTDEWAADLDALAGLPGLDGVILPKSEAGEQIEATAARLAPSTPVLALVETAAGIERADSIAAASATARLAFGSVDFCRELGITEDRTALLYARSRLVVACRAAGRPGPVDSPTVALDDPQLLDYDLTHAKSLGFAGKLCLHPRQVEATNKAFIPTEAELAWARRVVEVAGRSNGAAVRVDGEMIDRPRLATAHRIIQRAELYSGKTMS